MKKDFSKSSETQDFGKQEEENNKSPLDEILKAILGNQVSRSIKFWLKQRHVALDKTN